MNRFLFLFGFLAFGCSNKHKIILEPIIVNYDYERKIDSLGRQSTKRVIVEKTLIKDFCINITSKNRRKIIYTTEGNYKSSGLNAKRLNSKTVSKIANDTLHIQHQISTKPAFGKESANVVGYNFQKHNYLKFPKYINHVVIEIIEVKELSDVLINKIVLDSTKNPFFGNKSNYAMIKLDL